MATLKTVNGVKHTYTLNGSQIVSEEWKSGSTTHTLVYLYDESGSPIGLQYRPSSMVKEIFYTYFFEKNMQGDITAVFKENGAKIGAYTYDAWGNVKTTVYSNATTLEKNIVQSYNPFRYRGYYYDTESGLYYLQSRYYNPQWGRFLNADKAAVIEATPGRLTDKNLYLYCDNNPIMREDEDGEFWNFLVQAGVGALVGVTAQFVSDLVSSAIDGEFHMSSAGTYIGAAVGGAIGAFIPDPMLSGAASSAVATFIDMGYDNAKAAITGEGTTHSFEEIFYNTATNGLLGGLFGSFGETDFVKGIAPFSNKYANLAVNSFITSQPGSYFSGIMNSEFGRSMPTSHRWDRKVVVIAA